MCRHKTNRFLQGNPEQQIQDEYEEFFISLSRAPTVLAMKQETAIRNIAV
jgi:hypothetical protein